VLSAWTASRYLLRYGVRDSCLVSRMSGTVARAPHLRGAALVVTAGALAAIGYATLVPQPGTATESHLCVVCGSLGGVSAILNILLFVPLGIGLGLSGFSRKLAVTGMCTLSILIETAQLLVISGRNATIGDVLANTLGGALGFALARNVFILLRPSARVARLLTVGWAAVWLTIQTASAFAFSFSLPRSQYYGQIARELGGSEGFTGQVLHASLADVVVPDERFVDSHRARELLMRGATLTAAFLPPRFPNDTTPIVRIADDSEKEILLLAQIGPNIVYGVRTGAAALRLRPPLFALPRIFARAAHLDSTEANTPVTVRASYSAREVSVNAQSVASQSLRIPIRAAAGWTIFLPFEWFIEGSRAELAISAIWTALLLLPMGYWLARAFPFQRAQLSAMMPIAATVTALLVLYAGTILVPEVFGVNPASGADWLAALVGIFSGVALAPRPFAQDRELVGEPIRS
ncbi:MAG TPA: VanZ family protein, partial [Gemmatimonadaceae bacterium]|nr:VanZ family protein [Gemmatimonadaceae bacterium]